MGGLLDNNKSILKDAKGCEGLSRTLTLIPAATSSCALVVPPDSKSQAGMDSMRSVAPVLVDVEVAGPSPWVPRDGFLDLKDFFKMRFIYR